MVCKTCQEQRHYFVGGKKLLGNKELKEFQWDVAEYIKYGKENAINGQWIKQLENASAKVHISQLEAIKIRMQQSLEAAFKTEFDEIKKMGLDVVEDSCYRTAFEIQKGCGVGWQIGEIDKEKIYKIISKPWTTDGKTFSDRIWSRKQQMISDLQQELTRSCIYGRSFEETVKRMEQYVSSNVKNAKYAAERLVRTENASFSSMGQKEGLEKIGTKWYKIYVTIDGKTCPVCREMNGKKFRMSDFQIGITAPPFHPNCDKSSIGPTTPDNEEDEDELDRIRREVREEIKKTNTLSEKERFEEWKKKFVYGDKSEAEVVDKSENGGIINSRSDKVTINAIETPIEQRNTGKGNPNAILHFDIALNNRQIKILEQLPEYDSRVIVDKKSVSMTDLSALTAKTGDEFAMFTKGNERIIVRGNAVSVNIDVELAKKLSADGYKWSGHTHPGTDINVLMPSDGDKKILRCFDQEQSVIYSSKGSYQTFGKE